jgi:hypothetical protein
MERKLQKSPGHMVVRSLVFQKLWMQKDLTKLKYYFFRVRLATTLLMIDFIIMIALGNLIHVDRVGNMVGTLFTHAEN